VANEGVIPPKGVSRFNPQISQAYWQKAALHGITEFPDSS